MQSSYFASASVYHSPTLPATVANYQLDILGYQGLTDCSDSYHPNQDFQSTETDDFNTYGPITGRAHNSAEIFPIWTTSAEIEVQYEETQSLDGKVDGRRPSTETSRSGSVSCPSVDEARQLRRDRRRAQNRASQRAFRARKESIIKDISAKLADLEAVMATTSKRNENLTAELGTLRAQKATLERENEELRSRYGGSGCSSGASTPTSTTVGYGQALGGWWSRGSATPSASERDAAMANGLF